MDATEGSENGLNGQTVALATHQTTDTMAKNGKDDLKNVQ